MSFDELQSITRNLGEHFDAVQILVSFTEDGATQIWRPGCGNWHTRQGMAHNFIDADKTQDQAKEIAKAIHPEE